MTPDNLMRLQGALSDLHPVHRMPPERPSLQLTPETAAEFRNLSLETDWGSSTASARCWAWAATTRS